MEAFIPQESTREVRPSRNGGDEFSLQCGVRRSVFVVLNSAPVEIRDAC